MGLHGRALARFDDWASETGLLLDRGHRTARARELAASADLRSLRRGNSPSFSPRCEDEVWGIRIGIDSFAGNPFCGARLAVRLAVRTKDTTQNGNDDFNANQTHCAEIVGSHDKSRHSQLRRDLSVSFLVWDTECILERGLLVLHMTDPVCIARPGNIYQKRRQHEPEHEVHRRRYSERAKPQK